MTKPLLRLTGLVRRFGTTTALDRASFGVGKGEVVALLGENGAGKSTLVEILAGRLRPDAGEIVVEGARHAPRDPRQARARGVGVVHQHFQLVEAFSVAENLSLALGRLMGPSGAQRWRQLGTALGVDLPDLEARVADLGVGERQWLEIGKALLGRPQLLLLDEPTAVLTPGEAERLFQVIAQLAAGGTGILFITHRLDEVRQVAHRVVVLRRGAVVAELGSEAAPHSLAEAMTGTLPEAPGAKQRQPGRVVARLVEAAVPPRLHAMNLELRAGEIVVLAGVDGSGQVAAAERLAGLARGPGAIEIGGERLSDPEPPALWRRGVAVIPADRSRQGLVPALSVAENLILGQHHFLAGRGGTLKPRVVLEHGRRLVERFAIAGRAEQRAAELSGGNQQKVVVARALAARPSLLVAIHPTRGLDVAAQVAVRSHLHQAAADGAALLVVTADLDEARELGDRILVMSRGQVVGEGDRSTDAQLLARWMGGEAA